MENIVAVSREYSEERMLRLIVVLVGRKRTERSSRSLLNHSVKTVDEVVLQLCYVPVNGLQIELIQRILQCTFFA